LFRSPHTMRCIEGEMRRFLNDIGNIPVRDLTVDHMERWFYGPRGRNTQVEAGAFNNTVANLRAFCKWARDEGMLNEDPMRRVTCRKVYKRERQRLTPAQMTAAIESADNPRDRIALAIAIHTGVRVSSVAELRVGDVNLEAGSIRYVNVKLQRERTLPITAELDRELRSWLTVYTEQCGTPQKSWFLVPRRHRGGRAGQRSYIPSLPFTPRDIAHKALAAVDMDGRYEGFHTFRRSSARALFDALADSGEARAIHITQAFLDHSDASMTQHYIGTNHERQKLDEYLKGKSFMEAPAVEDSNIITVNFTRRRSG